MPDDRIFSPEEINALKADLAFAEPDENGVKLVFLDTCFALLPSGRFYAPWACSNVDEEEVDTDAAWFEKAEAELEEAGMFLMSGEEDPCDMFVGMVGYGEDGPED